MIYTVGSQKAYLKTFLKDGRVVKTGRRRGYPGGRAFHTRADAQRHIDELELQGFKGLIVFGLLADWEKDTKPGEDGWWHELVKDAEVVVLEKSEEVVE